MSYRNAFWSGIRRWIDIKRGKTRNFSDYFPRLFFATKFFKTCRQTCLLLNNAGISFSKPAYYENCFSVTGECSLICDYGHPGSISCYPITTVSVRHIKNYRFVNIVKTRSITFQLSSMFQFTIRPLLNQLRERTGNSCCSRFAI